AIKYSDPEKAERFVEIRARLNEPAAAGAGSELIVEVVDNGIGVPSDARDKLFDRFFRALGGNTAVEVEGTGLGLSIVRETIEMLGGRAWAEPIPTGGSVFAFSLPCRRSTDASAVSKDVEEKKNSDPGQRESRPA
ncbi:MAG TPA: ATP-binding protein, partial [Gemmatimonadaceae bacterium]|nr:ATP-binding protein [Gemmatimonadaceae bacterium]